MDKLAHFGPIIAGLFDHVKAVHGPRARFDEGQGGLESDAAVCTRHERNAVREGELLREQCRARWDWSFQESDECVNIEGTSGCTFIRGRGESPGDSHRSIEGTGAHWSASTVRNIHACW